MSEEHPIQGLMTTAMNSIKEMVDVNTIIGDAVETKDGTVIIPVSKVSFGFAAGGGEYSSNGSNARKSSSSSEDGGDQADKIPFGGGSGAGVSIVPVGFLVVGSDQLRLLPIGNNSSVDRIVDAVPEVLAKLNDFLKTKTTTKKVEIHGNDTTAEKETVEQRKTSNMGESKEMKE